MPPKIRRGFLCLLFAATPFTARADVIYDVTVDTSAIHNKSGFLDFDFAPGNDSQAAFIQVSGFSPGVDLGGTPEVNGGVTGTLPGSLTIDNSTAFNDYFQGFTFGDTISFQIALSGPAINSPTGTATSGSTFGFAMLDATGTDPLLTTDPNGNAFTIDVNLDGTTAVTDFSPNTRITQPQPVPEPGSAWLLTVVLAAFALKHGSARRRTNTNGEW